MKWTWSLPVLFLVFLPSVGTAADLSGHVVSVIDGDTLDIELKHGIERVRLNGIDAPESSQKFGKQARQFLETLTIGDLVTVETLSQDKYARSIGEVFLSDGRHLNRELVKAGLAWWFCRYSSDPVLYQLEEDAREAKRGLWMDPVPTPPWIYRKLQRNQVPDESEFDCPAPSVSAISSTAESAFHAHDVVGNKRSHIYHRADCPGYAKVSEGNRIPFVSVEAAEQAGYRVAGNCP